jgi:hypothetical protein
LLSYQIYAALKNERPRAKLLYSFYCARAPQTRYFDYDHVKKQMYKLHAPHKMSGYIADVELRETRDGEGRPDWEMLYTPGRKARAEFRSLKRTMRGPRAILDNVEGEGREKPRQLADSPPEQTVDLSPELEALVEQLVSHKVSKKKARELVEIKPESVRLHLRAIPYLPEGQGRKNFAGRLVTAIENDYELPQAFVEILERERREKATKEREAKKKGCHYCQEMSGWRYVKGRSGPVRRCTHDPVKEEAYSSD